MANADGSLRIVFNGEIYNYRDLRQKLEKKGFNFRSSSDTEVLLHLYACMGEGMVDVLRGMYAFVIWDHRRRLLFAARDPFGIKPLYIADDGSSIRIASQVKALLAGGHIDTSHEPAGQVGFLLWGYVPEPFTVYKAITAIPAGAHLTITADGRRSLRHFFRISEELARLEEGGEKNPGGDDQQPEFRDALVDSVKNHLMADVPVAVFLSAGLDSASLTGVAAEQSSLPLCTITLGFNEYRGGPYDETVYAASVADRYHTDHYTRWYNRDNFKSELQNIISAMDQPSTDGINTYFVSKAASSMGVKTALSGLGGDELFGSYPSFRDVPKMVRLLGGVSMLNVGRTMRRLTAPLISKMASVKYAGMLEYGGTYAGAYLLRRGLFMPWELPGILPREIAKEGWDRLAPLERLSETIVGIKSDRLKVSALEFVWYMRNQLLRDSDWAGMAHSVEIRVPLVDINVLRTLVPLLANRPVNGKRVLARVPEPKLPDWLLNRPKTGFVVPIRDWISSSQPRTQTRVLSTGLRRWALHLVSAFNLAA